MTVDPQSPAWMRGYADGYLGKPREAAPDADYADGHLTGEAEQDAPPDVIAPALYAQRKAQNP